MSRNIHPMPPEADRHFMIRSYGDQEPPRPEPTSRSPSPDLPPNFVPEAPKDSSHFPACSNIINMIERMSGGVRSSEQIIVPAHIWDRNNTHWEHKIIQLKRKHRKELTEKEAEIRIKYDQLYSDGRYREQLLVKELKELEFTKEVTSGVVLGKTWKEHKAAKKDMEERYNKKIEKLEKELAESQSSKEILLKNLTDAQTTIDVLEKAIGKRDEQPSTPVSQQALQPMQVIQHQPVQFQQPQELQQLQPQYYPQQQQNPNIMRAPTHDHFQAPQACFQQGIPFPYSQQQQQQHWPENAMTLYGGGLSFIAPSPATRPEFLDESPIASASSIKSYYDSTLHQGLSYQSGPQGYQENHTISSINEKFHDNSHLTPPTSAVTTDPQWNSPFSIPQTPKNNTEVATNQLIPQNDAVPCPTSGLSGPFGKQSKALVKASSQTFGQTLRGSTSRLDNENENDRPGKPTKNMLKAPQPLVSSSLRISRRPLIPPPTSDSYITTEKGESQKRPHSVLSTAEHVSSQPSNDSQVGNPRSIQQIDSSEDEDDGEANAFPKKRKYQQSQPTILRTSAVPRIMEPPPRRLSITQKNPDKITQNTQVDKVRKKVQPAATELERVSVHVNSLSRSERLNAVSTLIKDSKNGNRAMVVALKRGLGWTGPAYIITKVRGGQLESIKVMESEHKVYIKFVSPNPAQTFYDFFNKEPDASQADNRFKMDVKWAHKARCEISRELADAIISGATRCLKIFQLGKDKRPEDVNIDLNPDEEPWNILEFTIADDTSGRKSKQGGGKVAKIDFSSIELAIETKERIESGLLPGYENCDVEYSEDPSAFRDGTPCCMSFYRTW